MKIKILSLAYKVTLTTIMIAALGCGSSDKATVTTPQQPQGESSPILNGSEQETIRLGQAVTQLQMNHTETETIFETRDVPATCTRVVQRGTHSECHTEYQQVCNTRYEQECRNVPYPVCTNHQENVCRNVPDQVCHTQEVPVCQNVPRQVCETVQKCETVSDRVCRGTPPNQTCTTVPRRVCHAEQSCHTKNDQVCHNESRRVCEQITRRECHLENRQQCHNENRQECSSVPRQHCESVPRQACIEVPTTVQEQYSCMQPEQVPVGERVKLHQLAQIRIDLVNPRNLDVSKDDLIVTLNQGMVSAVVNSVSGIQYQVRETSRFSRRTSETEELITVTLEVTALF